VIHSATELLDVSVLTISLYLKSLQPRKADVPQQSLIFLVNFSILSQGVGSFTNAGFAFYAVHSNGEARNQASKILTKSKSFLNAVLQPIVLQARS